jgi:hypothetical protein
MSEQFGVTLSRTSVTVIGARVDFKCEWIFPEQPLTAAHVADGGSFCHKML